MIKYGGLIFLSIVTGTLARAFMLRIDYRQFPSFPHSYIIHLTMGMIASALGALVIPALLAEDYIAITFLTIGAQQFREVRNLERDSLDRIERTELVIKGTAYIEGIAKLFEARNYLALITSLTTGAVYYFLGRVEAVIIGGIVAFLLHLMLKGPHVDDIAKVEIVPLTIKGYNIGVEDIIIMNVGEEEALSKWKNEGIGIKVIPRDENSRATLFNEGQRQAILHDLSILMGIKLDKGIQHYTPLARLNINNGTLNIIIIPQEPDEEFIREAIKRIPVIESSQRKPLKSLMGRKAAD